MPIALTDSNYRQQVGQAARRLAGVGFAEGVIPHFAVNFELYRAMTGMSASAWPDSVFAYLMFGQEEGAAQTAPPNFNRKKLGRTAFSVEDAATLAQLMTFFASLPAADLDRYRPALIDTAAIVFVTTAAPRNFGLYARDLALPPQAFAGRLAALLMDRLAAPDLDTLHDRVMAHLTGLRARSDPHRAVGFGRDRAPDPGIPRFGSNQTPPAMPPWQREPLTFRAGDRPIVGLDFTRPQPCAVWALTVCDPRPARAAGRDGSRCWETPWDELVRWSVPSAPVPAGAPLRVDYGAMAAREGSFDLFLLLDGEDAVWRALGLARGEPVTVAALFRLLSLAGDLRKPLGFDVYARRYRVRG